LERTEYGEAQLGGGDGDGDDDGNGNEDGNGWIDLPTVAVAV